MSCCYYDFLCACSIYISILCLEFRFFSNSMTTAYYHNKCKQYQCSKKRRCLCEINEMMLMKLINIEHLSSRQVGVHNSDFDGAIEVLASFMFIPSVTHTEFYHSWNRHDPTYQFSCFIVMKNKKYCTNSPESWEPLTRCQLPC